MVKTFTEEKVIEVINGLQVTFTELLDESIDNLEITYKGIVSKMEHDYEERIRNLQSKLNCSIIE